MANQIDTDAKVIGESINGFGQQNIIANSSGRLYAVHITDSNDIEIHYSDNDGTNWTLDITFSSVTNPRFLCFSKSENDDIFLSYVEGTISPFTIKMKRFEPGSGGGWTEILSVSETTASDQVPGCLSTYNRAINRSHIFWMDNDSGKFFKSRYSDDYGDSWTTVEYTYGTSTYPMYMWAIDSNPITGDIYILGMQSIGEASKLRKFNSANVYQSTNNISVANSGLGGAFSIDSAGNLQGMLYVYTTGVYYLYEFAEITEAILENHGSTDTYKTGMFAVSVDGNDDFYCFYVKESDNKIYYRKRSGGSWGSETLYTSGSATRPSCEQHTLPTNNKLNIVYYNS